MGSVNFLIRDINFDYSSPQKDKKEDHKSNNNNKIALKVLFLGSFELPNCMGGVHTYVKKVKNFGPSSTVSEETGIRKTFGHNVQCAPLNIRIKEKNYFANFIKDAKRREKNCCKIDFWMFSNVK